MSRLPIQWRQAVELGALTDEVVNRLETFWSTPSSKLFRYLQYVYAILRNTAIPSRNACCFQQSNTGEEGLGTRALQLVFELRGVVRSIGRCMDATQTSSGPC